MAIASRSKLASFIFFVLLTIVKLLFKFSLIHEEKSKPQSKIEESENLAPLFHGDHGQESDHIESHSHQEQHHHSHPQPHEGVDDPTELELPLEEITQPNVETYREEVKRNPHHTPPSIIRFAALLAPHITRGMKDVNEAEKVFNYLQDCALEKNTVPVSSRAFCVSTAEGFAKRFPQSYESRYQTLKNRVDQDVAELLGKMKAFDALSK